MIEQNQHLDALQDIRRMMQRSSRFISLSGLSGIAAGIWALIGAYFAYDWIHEYYQGYEQTGYTNERFSQLKFNLILLSAAVVALAVVGYRLLAFWLPNLLGFGVLQFLQAWPRKTAADAGLTP